MLTSSDGTLAYGELSRSVCGAVVDAQRGAVLLSQRGFVRRAVVVAERGAVPFF